MTLLYWLDRNVEKTIILASYVAMAGIIFVEVIRRFLFDQQAAWSSTIPIYLFLWVTWMGASWNVRIRTHLSFDELRSRMPRNAQFACLLLDAALWIVFAVIVIYYTVEQVTLAYDNFAIVQGTDNVLQWWFYLATPLAWSLLIVRVLQNLRDDIVNYRTGEPLFVSTSILGV